MGEPEKEGKGKAKEEGKPAEGQAEKPAIQAARFGERGCGDVDAAPEPPLPKYAPGEFNPPDTQ